MSVGRRLRAAVFGLLGALALAAPAAASATLTGVLSRPFSYDPLPLDLAISGPAGTTDQFALWFRPGYVLDGLNGSQRCATGQPSGPVMQGFVQYGYCSSQTVPESLRFSLHTAGGGAYPESAGGLICGGPNYDDCGPISGPGPPGGSGTTGGAPGPTATAALPPAAKKELRRVADIDGVVAAFACGLAQLPTLARGGVFERQLGSAAYAQTQKRFSEVCTGLLRRLDDIDIALEHDPPAADRAQVALATAAPHLAGRGSLDWRFADWVQALDAITGIDDALAASINRLGSARTAGDQTATALQLAAVAVYSRALSQAVTTERAAARALASALIAMHATTTTPRGRLQVVLDELTHGRLIPAAARCHLSDQGADVGADARAVFGPIAAPRAPSLTAVLRAREAPGSLDGDYRTLTLASVRALFAALRGSIPASIAAQLEASLAGAETAGDGTTVQQHDMQQFVALAERLPYGRRLVLSLAGRPFTGSR